MKRTSLVLMVLAICVMMAAPMAMAGGKPNGENAKKYSHCFGDFEANPTQGEWNYAGRVHWYATGGVIKIWNVPESVADGSVDGVNYMIWDTHLESLLMGKGRAKNGAPLQWAPKDLDVGVYQVPGEVIIGVSFYIQMQGYGDNGDVWLTALLHTGLHPLPDGMTVTIERTDTQIILSGTDIPFNYYDWMHESISDPPNTYGSTTHTFSIAMDI